MKRAILSTIFFFCIYTLVFALSRNQIYSCKEEWYRGDVKGGEIQIQIQILDVFDGGAFVSISKTITPFSQIIQTKVICNLRDGKYFFEFIDNWGNKAFGYFSESEKGIEFYLDCNEFSDNGKNLARLYGDTFLLKADK